MQKLFSMLFTGALLFTLLAPANAAKQSVPGVKVSVPVPGGNGRYVKCQGTENVCGHTWVEGNHILFQFLNEKEIITLLNVQPSGNDDEDLAEVTQMILEEGVHGEVCEDCTP